MTAAAAAVLLSLVPGMSMLHTSRVRTRHELGAPENMLTTQDFFFTFTPEVTHSGNILLPKQTITLNHVPTARETSRDIKQRFHLSSTVVGAAGCCCGLWLSCRRELLLCGVDSACFSAAQGVPKW